LIGGGAVVLLVVFLWRSRDAARRGRLLFGAAWLALTLVPSLLLKQQTAEFDYLHHRLYVPMFGLVVIVLELAARRGVGFEQGRAARAGAAVAGAFALLTVLATRDYRDGLTFWTSAVRAARTIRWYQTKTCGSRPSPTISTRTCTTTPRAHAAR
jgi:peptidoglycan/LPS O-acetylase OafA/YrhL